MALDPITAGIGLVDTFIQKFVGDKDLAIKLMRETRSEEFQGQVQLLMGQLEINRAEAESPSLFKGGWRPFIGWTCGIAFAYNFVIYPLFKTIILTVIYMLVSNGVITPDPNTPLVLPVLDLTEMMPVLLGMLGLGTMRSFEKKHGVAAP